MAVLADAPALAAELSSPAPPVLLDVRWSLTGPPGRPEYDMGHLPGARYVDLDTELSGPPAAEGSGGRHPLPSATGFQAAMRRAGVRANSRVVVYGNADGWGPARAWWCLRYFGHTDVRLLDGGFPAWERAGLPVETTPPESPERAVVDAGDADGDFVAQPGGMPLLDAGGAAELARFGVLLDARAGERYRGETEPLDPAAGHIPGAMSAATTDNVDSHGRLRGAEELRRRFAELGATDSADVGVYCGSGVSAAHEVLALEAAGVRAALYVGSWSDWSSDPWRPVATGPEPG